MVQRIALVNKAFYSSFDEVKKPSSSSINMKPSIQILDIKAKGAEFAKKMKKSRSFKKSADLDRLKQSSLRKTGLSTNNHLPQESLPRPRATSASPNYMKSTSSSLARKEQNKVNTKTPSKSVMESISKRLFSSSPSLSKVRTLTKAPSFKPSRSAKSSKCLKTSLCDVKRNTCSSTMKDSKFPNYLDLTLGASESKGASIMKVCPYSYCSLNGHHHSSTSPPLKSFLCARRRVMKAKKVKPCLDDDQGKEEVVVVKALLKEEKEDFFVEIYEKKGDQEKEYELKDDECVYDVGSFYWESSDTEWEEEGKAFFTRLEDENGAFTPSDHESDETKENEIEYLLDEGDFKKDDASMESSEFSQDEIIDYHEQLSDSDSSMNDGFEEKELDQFFQVHSIANEEKKSLEELSTLAQDSRFTKNPSNDAQEKQEKDTRTMQATEEEQKVTQNKPNENLNKNYIKKQISKAELPSPCTSSSLIITKEKRKQTEKSEELKSFNPRDPNFLDVEQDPEGERVDLKHQEIDERRNSEEWMVDFALRKAVNNLAQDRKKKVAMLVAAFETVLPPSRALTCN